MISNDQVGSRLGTVVPFERHFKRSVWHKFRHRDSLEHDFKLFLGSRLGTEVPLERDFK